MSIITEEKIKAKVATLIPGKHWRKICLLILFSAPIGKLASRSFIYEKLRDWELLNLEGEEKFAFLKSISVALYNLHDKEGWVKNTDLSRMGQKEFENFCTKQVVGTISTCAKHRTQTVYQISSDGKREARAMFGPQPMMKYERHERVAAIIGRQ